MAVRIGLVYAVIQGLCFSLFATCASLVSDATRKYYISGMRSPLAVVLMLPASYIYYGNAEKYNNQLLQILYVPKLRNMLAIRVVSGFASITLMAVAIGFITIGDAAAIRSLATPITAIIAYVWLKEKLSHLQKLLTVVSLVGMVLMARSKPPSNVVVTNSTLDMVVGIVLMVLSAMTVSIGSVASRSAGKLLTFVDVSFYINLFGCVVYLPALLATGFMPFNYLSNVPVQDTILLAAISIISILGQMLKKLAIDNEKAALAQIAMNTQVIFSYAIQILFLGDIPNAMAISGSILILGSAIGLKLA